jgi:hypothetical protein
MLKWLSLVTCCCVHISSPCGLKSCVAQCTAEGQQDGAHVADHTASSFHSVKVMRCGCCCCTSIGQLMQCPSPCGGWYLADTSRLLLQTMRFSEIHASHAAEAAAGLLLGAAHQHLHLHPQQQQRQRLSYLDCDIHRGMCRLRRDHQRAFHARTSRHLIARSAARYRCAGGRSMRAAAVASSGGTCQPLLCGGSSSKHSRHSG